MRRCIKYPLSIFALGVLVPLTWCALSGEIDTSRRTPTVTTLTQLPPFPRIPKFASRLSKREKRKLQLKLVDSKLSTYPPKPSTSYRAGKFRLSPFQAFGATEDHIRTIAPHYDLVVLSGPRSKLAPLFKKYNPSIKVILYLNANLCPNMHLYDVGSVDKQDTRWMLKTHPEWFLKDGKGNPIKAAASTSTIGVYFPDPGNREYQKFFAEKVKKALQLTGNIWDGVLIDEFFVRHISQRVYAGTAQQVNYRDDKAFQSAQISFLKSVCPLIKVPIIPNVEARYIGDYPEFFSRVITVAGGAEAECFVMHAPTDYGYFDERRVKTHLDLVRKAPKDKIVFVMADTAGIAGDIDRTLYFYYTYLLVADRKKQLYWNYKEGSSSFPHYWYKEFDLDLGNPEEEMQTIKGVWKRAFKNAIVVVNPTRKEQRYSLQLKCYDVLGRPLRGPLRLRPHTGQLLIKNKSILPKKSQRKR